MRFISGASGEKYMLLYINLLDEGLGFAVECLLRLNVMVNISSFDTQ